MCLAITLIFDNADIYFESLRTGKRLTVKIQVPGNANRADKIAAGAGADDAKGGLRQTANPQNAVGDLVYGTVTANRHEIWIAFLGRLLSQQNGVTDTLGILIIKNKAEMLKQPADARPLTTGREGTGYRIDDNLLKSPILAEKHRLWQ